MKSRAGVFMRLSFVGLLLGVALAGLSSPSVSAAKRHHERCKKECDENYHRRESECRRLHGHERHRCDEEAKHDHNRCKDHCR